MLNFLFRRIAMVVPTLIGITICAFLVRAPLARRPDPFALAGQHGVTPERYEQLKIEFGFDKPMWEQYLTYIGKILQGDFRPVDRDAPARSWSGSGNCFRRQSFRFPSSLPPSSFRSVSSPPAKPPRSRRRSGALMGTALVGYSITDLLVVCFSSSCSRPRSAGPRVGSHWIAVLFQMITGFATIDSLLYGNIPAFLSALRYLILPIVLGTVPLAVLARQTRSACSKMGEGLCAHRPRQASRAAASSAFTPCAMPSSSCHPRSAGRRASAAPSLPDDFSPGPAY